MKNALPVALATLVGAPLIALSVASPAAAAPADVTMSATGGSTVAMTFTNNSTSTVNCTWWLISDTNPTLSNSGQANTISPQSSQSATTTLTSGAYQVAWVCTAPSTGESWGTAGKSSTVTAQATAVTITSGSPVDSIAKLFGSS